MRNVLVTKTVTVAGKQMKKRTPKETKSGSSAKKRRAPKAWRSFFRASAWSTEGMGFSKSCEAAAYSIVKKYVSIPRTILIEEVSEPRSCDMIFNLEQVVGVFISFVLAGT